MYVDTMEVNGNNIDWLPKFFRILCFTEEIVPGLGRVINNDRFDFHLNEIYL